MPFFDKWLVVLLFFQCFLQINAQCFGDSGTVCGICFVAVAGVTLFNE